MGRPLTESVLTDVANVIKTAWSCNSVRVGRRLLATSAYPVAAVMLKQLSRRSGSPTQSTYDYSIEIAGRFAYTSSAADFIGREQIERANDAIDALLNSSVMSPVSYGTLLDVPEVSFSEGDEDASRYYEVVVTFTIAITGTVRP
jgi:hypothetical protein